jgi:melibiose permease/lactose/raffinose/galactose permease
MIFYPVISSKIHRKPLMNIMASISVVGYIFMILSRVIPAVGFGLLVLGYMLSNFGQYSYYLIMMISIINTVEYNEYKCGTRDEAIIASVRPFMTKMASAIIVMITTASYVIFGVTNYTNQISDLESAAAIGTIAYDHDLSMDKVMGGFLILLEEDDDWKPILMETREINNREKINEQSRS